MTTLEALVRRDRTLVTLGLVAIAALAWAYMVSLASDMDAMGSAAAMEMAMPTVHAWTATELVLLFVMWAVMMVAMMVPSASPVVLLVAAVNRTRRERESPLLPTGLFLGGYLLVWTLFSAVATAVQWGLHSLALLSPMMVSTSPILGGALLAGAGIFQWTPLKRACLVHCRSPLAFLMHHWRDGSNGALWMGMAHGSYCVGCCWVLMALLFVAGVMNLLWVAAIATFVLVEKLVPRGDWIGRVGGGLLVAAGLLVAVRG